MFPPKKIPTRLLAFALNSDLIKQTMLLTLRYASDGLVADLPTIKREADYQLDLAERNLKAALSIKEAADENLQNAKLELQRASWRRKAVLRSGGIDTHNFQGLDDKIRSTVISNETHLEIVGPRDPRNEFIIDENGVFHGYGGVGCAGGGGRVQGQKRKAEDDAFPTAPIKRIKRNEFISGHYQILSSLD
jgi:hypothetical protein